MILTFIILTAFLWAFICYFLAKNKGRDEYWAFFIGLFFGIFAILYYLCCAEGSVRCPYCKEKIKKDAIVCKHCGKEVGK